MNRLTIVLMLVVVSALLIGYLAIKWYKLFNSPDGERHHKRRMQGPLVPLSADEVDEVDEDKARPAARIESPRK